MEPSRSILNTANKNITKMDQYLHQHEVEYNQQRHQQEHLDQEGQANKFQPLRVPEATSLPEEEWDRCTSVSNPSTGSYTRPTKHEKHRHPGKNEKDYSSDDLEYQPAPMAEQLQRQPTKPTTRPSSVNDALRVLSENDTVLMDKLMLLVSDYNTDQKQNSRCRIQEFNDLKEEDVTTDDDFSGSESAKLKKKKRATTFNNSEETHQEATEEDSADNDERAQRAMFLVVPPALKPILKYATFAMPPSSDGQSQCGELTTPREGRSVAFLPEIVSQQLSLEQAQQQQRLNSGGIRYPKGRLFKKFVGEIVKSDIPWGKARVFPPIDEQEGENTW